MKNAFILDLDGTLLDSMGAWSRVGHIFLEKQGKRDIPDNLWDIIRPMSRLESADYFIAHWGIRLSPEEIRAELNRLMEHAYEQEVKLKQGAWEFLKIHSNKKMCIATNTDRHLVEYILAKLGIDEYFKFIITTSEVESGKHNPRIFLTAAEKLDVSVSEAVVFEDALHGIRSAKEAGFYTVGVYDQDNESEKGQIMEIADDYVYRLSDWEEM